MMTKTRLFFTGIILAISTILSGCVAVEPEPPVVVNGFASYLEKIALPQGCTINIAIIDLNTPGSILSQKSFDIARVPVPFKFIFPADVIDSRIKYGVVAMITYQEQVIFQTYDKFEVINNNKFTTEVLMKPVR
ncbi:YbaY family lipoprotein [Shewanella aestuarii]|uniref:Chaperone for general secretion pathway YbaY n=1 Tax=Shewanella aestuarii TaxID=1028752 RepID=A0A6G9QNF8_9GAMM|nr:YbaY family lipoprotein [Shewanella aestuarii]QIR16130.1 chaperone for general secretion pathway YbaY [Shewanella aestuarii]